MVTSNTFDIIDNVTKSIGFSYVDTCDNRQLNFQSDYPFDLIFKKESYPQRVGGFNSINYFYPITCTHQLIN